MEWPIYFRDRLILGNPESNVGLVTLWTPKEKIADIIGKENFAVAGQLYSKEGISYLIRNIFANPRIQRLVICGEERSGSGKALLSLFKNGVDNENRIIGEDFAQIHPEIPKEKLEEFRKNVVFENLIGTCDGQKISREIAKKPREAVLWTKPETFKENVPVIEGSMPTDKAVFKIRGKYAGEVWLEILKKIMRFGEVRESFHGNNCRELFNIAAVITDEDPDNFKMYPFFRISKKDVKDYLPKMMTGERGTADYTYGERLWNFPQTNGKDYKYNQVKDVIIDYLSRYPTDRAACASIFGVRDHTAKSSPCMTFLQATNVDGKLDLTAYFRSHDIFGGWLLNAFGLRTLQKHIADKLGMKLGNLVIYSNCAHIYDNNWGAVQEIIDKFGGRLNCSPDPRGYLIILVEGHEIVIKHYSPEGRYLQEFREDGVDEKVVMKLHNRLLLSDVVSQISHAFYVGEELQKAEIAVKNGLRYVQDKPLVL